MNEMRADTLAVLRAVSKHGPLTLGELRDLEIPGTNAKSSVMNLQTHRYIETVKRSINDSSVYAVTSKGERMLRAIDAGKGDVAGPRNPISSDNYTGERKAHVRPGAMDAYSLPSLHDGEAIERKRPMLIGSSQP
jgi:hypothetical protein